MLCEEPQRRLVNLAGSCDLTAAGILQRERRTVGRLGSRTDSGDRFKSGIESRFETKRHRKSMGFHTVSDAMRRGQITTVREPRESLAEITDE